MSVVKEYHRLHKFNVMEIAHAKNGDAKEESRVPVPAKAADGDSSQ